MAKTPISIRLEKILGDEETTLYKNQGKWVFRELDGTEYEGDTLDAAIGQFLKPIKRTKIQSNSGV